MPLGSINHMLCMSNNVALHRKLPHVWSRFLSYSLIKNTINPSVVLHEKVDGNGLAARVEKLKQKLEDVGIIWQNSFTPGLYHILYCPKCNGGPTMERSLSLHLIRDGGFAMWSCFLDECGWAGQALADGDVVNKYRGVEISGQLTEHIRGLKPLGSKLIAYFNERKISERTLKRNAVMQLSGSQDIIAFIYRLNDHIVACKYRTLGKRFWQEKDTQKILYGLDDIKDTAEIVIVEGEIDKLSVEEAGLLNCVSVPNGAPQKISSKQLPPIKKDTAYQYLWNCKEYLDKASRITLATDGDAPGQALAAELANRLGKERCRRICWPRRNQVSCFKDANEVLKYLGPVALRDIIEDAESMD